MEFPLTVESHVVHFSRKMSREELNMHSLTLIPDDTLTLVAKMVFVQVWIMWIISRIILQR